MNKLYVLGTGNAMVTKCYNTCFTIWNGKEHFLVDTGGGNGILSIFENLNIDINNIHNIFISHKHTDHLLGLFWIIRKICSSLVNGTYIGVLNIYCHNELVTTINTISNLIIQNKFLKLFGTKINIIPVQDREIINICEHEIQFVDINSIKDLQYGFIAKLNDGTKLAFLGDEPYKNNFDDLIKGSDWLLNEAFCLYNQRDIFKPYEKSHNTVKDTSEIAQKLNIKNLILWHTEDKNIKCRKDLYTKEAKQYFDGNVVVPNDLDIINL
jgi:Metal-dependent hydrolases of the beta-lactamase superfamily III